MSFEKKKVCISLTLTICIVYFISFPLQSIHTQEASRNNSKKNTKFILMCVFLFSFDQIKIIINIMSFFHFLLLSSIFFCFINTHSPITTNTTQTTTAGWINFFSFVFYRFVYILIYIAIITIIIIKNLA